MRNLENSFIDSTFSPKSSFENADLSCARVYALARMFTCDEGFDINSDTIAQLQDVLYYLCVFSLSSHLEQKFVFSKRLNHSLSNGVRFLRAAFCCLYGADSSKGFQERSTVVTHIHKY